MNTMRWWLRIVGLFYLLQFIAMVVVRAPIRSAGPAGVLDNASAGDPTATFLVDTWTTFGLEVGAIGIVLLVASRFAAEARLLVWAIIAIELARGIVLDVYMLARGYPAAVYGTWIPIHALVIATAFLALRRSGAPGAA